MMPSSATHTPFDLLLLDSEHFIQWHPPTHGGGQEEVPMLVVLLGWLGGSQNHLGRYADLYRDRGFGVLRFIFPLSMVIGRHFGRRFNGRVANLSGMIAAWCDEDRRRTLLLHTFSQSGWLTSGVLLESLQSRPDIIQRIRGCITDSAAPVLEIRPEIWAAGFSCAILKKKRSSSARTPSADSPDAPSWGEALFISALRNLFKIIFRIPDVNKRLCKVVAILWENQPSCPHFYMYSSADRVVPAEDVESFISKHTSLGLTVFAHNFVSSPHVDHYRSFPCMYLAKLDEFLNICYPAKEGQSKL